MACREGGQGWLVTGGLVCQASVSHLQQQQDMPNWPVTFACICKAGESFQHIIKRHHVERTEIDNRADMERAISYP